MVAPEVGSAPYAALNMRPRNMVEYKVKKGNICIEILKFLNLKM